MHGMIRPRPSAPGLYSLSAHRVASYANHLAAVHTVVVAVPCNYTTRVLIPGTTAAVGHMRSLWSPSFGTGCSHKPLQANAPAMILRRPLAPGDLVLSRQYGYCDCYIFLLRTAL